MGDLERAIRTYCVRKLGHEPNLDCPTSYNDKVQWLKLHAQTPLTAQCCDKLGVRDYIKDVLPDADFYLNRIYGETPRGFGHLSPRAPSVVKCNHDSGSVHIVRDISQWSAGSAKIGKGLARKFGVRSGEWGYWHIPPICFTEEYFPGGHTDYKFHCCEGRIKWVQVISARRGKTADERIYQPDGKLMPLHLDHDFRHMTTRAHLPLTWNEMLYVAQELSRPFKYVRVDMFTHGDDVRVGELTFWPKAGCYKTGHENAFGALMDFKLERLPPLVT